MGAVETDRTGNGPSGELHPLDQDRVCRVDPSDTSIATIDAISEGSPMRECRVPFNICSLNYTGNEACICGVITKPGATALARMFCLPQAEATWRTSASMPALVMA